MILLVHLGIIVAHLETTETQKRLSYSQDYGSLLYLNDPIIKRVSHNIFIRNHETQSSRSGHSKPCQQLRNQKLSHCRAYNTVAISMPRKWGEPTPLELQFIDLIFVYHIA